MPINANQYQSIPINTNQYQSMPINTNQYQSIPINTNQCQSMPINTNQYQSMPINTNYRVGTRSRDQHKTNQHRCKHWSQWLSIVDEALLLNEFRFAGIQRSFHWTVTYTSRSEQGHVATMELSIEAGHAHWKVSTRKRNRTKR